MCINQNKTKLDIKEENIKNVRIAQINSKLYCLNFRHVILNKITCMDEG